MDRPGRPHGECPSDRLFSGVGPQEERHDLAAHLLGETEAGLERVLVALVDLGRDPGRIDRFPVGRDPEPRVALGDLLDADEDLHVDSAYWGG